MPGLPPSVVQVLGTSDWKRLPSLLSPVTCRQEVHVQSGHVQELWGDQECSVRTSSVLHRYPLSTRVQKTVHSNASHTKQPQSTRWKQNRYYTTAGLLRLQVSLSSPSYKMALSLGFLSHAIYIPVLTPGFALSVFKSDGFIFYITLLTSDRKEERGSRLSDSVPISCSGVDGSSCYKETPSEHLAPQPLPHSTPPPPATPCISVLQLIQLLRGEVHVQCEHVQELGGDQACSIRTESSELSAAKKSGCGANPISLYVPK